MKIVSPSPLTGEGGGEGELKPLPPHLNPLPRRGEEVFGVIFYVIENIGFLLEFIPGKTGAGMTESSLFRFFTKPSFIGLLGAQSGKKRKSLPFLKGNYKLS